MNGKTVSIKPKQSRGLRGMRTGSVVLYIALIVSISLGLCEIGIRAAGAVDFPIYDVGGATEYIPQKNQQGRFLNRNDWYFNNYSMPTRKDWPATNHAPGILLIGNSIVMGGDVFRQEEKLPDRLAAALGGSALIWPIAAGGWTQINEMAYLDQHPDVVAKATYFAWEYMSGGLSAATPWGGEYVFPSHRPVFATWYVFRRYVVPRLLPWLHGSELPVRGATSAATLREFDRRLVELTGSIRRREAGIIWLYPNAAELRLARVHREWLPERRQLLYMSSQHGLRIVDIAMFSQWNEACYRGDGVHPNVHGNEVLADILATQIRSGLR